MTARDIVVGHDMRDAMAYVAHHPDLTASIPRSSLVSMNAPIQSLYGMTVRHVHVTTWASEHWEWPTWRSVLTRCHQRTRPEERGALTIGDTVEEQFLNALAGVSEWSPPIERLLAPLDPRPIA